MQKKSFTKVASASMEKDANGVKVEGKACAGKSEGKACCKKMVQNLVHLRKQKAQNNISYKILD